MPDPINGVHLQPEQLDSPNIMKAIEDFAKWVVTSKFKPLSPDLEKCLDEKREEEFWPLLNAIGFGNEVRYPQRRSHRHINSSIDSVSSPTNNEQEIRHSWDRISSSHSYRTRRKAHHLRPWNNNGTETWDEDFCR